MKKYYYDPPDMDSEDGGSPRDPVDSSATERRKALTDDEFDMRKLTKKVPNYIEIVNLGLPMLNYNRKYYISQEKPSDYSRGTFSSDAKIFVCVRDRVDGATLPDEGDIVYLMAQKNLTSTDDGVLMANTIEPFRVIQVINTKLASAQQIANKILVFRK